LRYLIEHETTLTFPTAVREHQCELRLAPRDNGLQRRLAAEVTVRPEVELRESEDCFGNLVHRFSLLPQHDTLHVGLRAEVETLLTNPFDYMPLPPPLERAWVERRILEDLSLYDFVLHRSASIPDVAALGGLTPPAYEADNSLLENVQVAMGWIHESIEYVPGATEVHAALTELAANRAGVCQDFAHLLIAIVRSWGFAARYVMGFAESGTIGTEAAANEATHAWAEVLIPGAGWRGFDATARLVVNDTYVVVAIGRDSRDAAPLRGTFKGDDGGASPEVTVRVLRQEAEEQAAQ
jgi:transglutaminase-like putative cysteine protease